MTIVGAVAAPDGLAFACDSRTIQFEGVYCRVASDTAIKLFRVRNCLVATWGLADFGGQTIHGLIDEFERMRVLPVNASATDVAHGLQAFVDLRFREAVGSFDVSQGWPLGFLVGGYDEDFVGRVYEVLVPGHVTEVPVGTDNPGVVYRGERAPAERLFRGVDWGALTAKSVSADVRATLSDLEYRTIEPRSVDDAIKRVRLIVSVTIDTLDFTDGTKASPRSIASCGGPIRLAVVTRSGVEWIQNPPRTAR